MPKITLETIPERRGSGYPLPWRTLAQDRVKKTLGDAAGLTDFGVNLTHLPPGNWSSQRHWHSHEDEFVYVIEGELTLVTDAGEEILKAGDCAGFKAGVADGHCFINKSSETVVYLEVGSRKPEIDECDYPDIDMTYKRVDGRMRFCRKDGTPYE